MVLALPATAGGGGGTLSITTDAGDIGRWAGKHRRRSMVLQEEMILIG